MSDTNKRLLFIYIGLFFYLLVSCFISFTTSKILLYLNPLLLFLISICTYYLTKGYSVRNRNKYSKSQNVIIIIIFYFIIYYLSGLVFGFLKNGYSLSISGILNNFIIYFSVILFKEYIRCRLIFTNKKKMNLIWISILFIVLDLEFKSLFYLSSGFDFFEYIFNDLIPIIVVSITSTYLVYRIGHIPNYIYRGMLGGIVLFSPILPDLNWFVTNLFLIILFILLVFSIEYLVELEDRKVSRRKLRKGSSFGTYILMFITVLLVLFVVGVFKYQPIAILSNSMKGEFSKGDAVIVEKISKDDLSTIKKDDIIYYKYDGRYITHRVVDVKEVNGSYVYRTKGDNNEILDDWNVYGYTIEGVVRGSIKYVGWPAVWFSSLVA